MIVEKNDSRQSAKSPNTPWSVPKVAEHSVVGVHDSQGSNATIICCQHLGKSHISVPFAEQFLSNWNLGYPPSAHAS
jgi:hypothetical protein